MFRLSLLTLLLAPLGAAHADNAADEAAVRQAISRLAPDAEIEVIRPSAMPGVYEALVGGSEIYVSADGKYLMQGTLWNVEARRNLTEDGRALRRKQVLAEVGNAQRIIYAAAQPKHRVTVFTAIDCGYCRKLHEAVQQYNDAGISIEYILFPRGGLQSPSYQDSVSVWCAEDRKAALTAAKRGEPVATAMCPNPIQQNLALAQRLGINSTPTLVTETGTALLGFVPPDQLLAQLDAASAQP